MKIYKTACYADKSSQSINAERYSGEMVCIPVSNGNSDYQLLLEEKIKVQKYTAPQIPYTKKRAKEYPPIGEQLDAIWKFLNSHRLAGNDLPKDADLILGKILAVKKKYPKITK